MQQLREVVFSPIMVLTALVIVGDIIFGLIYAWQRNEWQSRKAHNGLIRKAGIVLAVLFFSVVDYILGLNLKTLLGEDIRIILNFSGSSRAGIADLLCLYVIVFEGVSVLENMQASGIDLPPILIKHLKMSKEKMSKGDEGNDN